MIFWGVQVFAQDGVETIPLGGNGFGHESGAAAGGRITDAGIEDWTDAAQFFDVWFYVSRGGSLNVSLRGDVPEGKSVLRVSLPDVGVAARELAISGGSARIYAAGSYTLSKAGYYRVRIEGLRKTGRVFAHISDLQIGFSGASIRYVRNNEGNFFHWGRRGPSVHLNYPLPDTLHAEYFYNEVTVPAGKDIMGSYFMADGFGQGYFGMQVNSPTERHILFSVWSPFDTDNPTAIPDSQKIVLVKKGPGVHAGEFGNEGSGGQSWLDYPWKAGNTYRFLVRARPIEHGYTQFTAWFYTPEDAGWKLIACFNRPQTQSWMTRLHSFLENFIPEEGNQTREVLFGRQWVRDDKGRWLSLRKAKFTGDNTARKGYRLDYDGGVRGDRFYLRNGGFFNDPTALDGWFERAADAGDVAPAIDVDQLP